MNETTTHMFCSRNVDTGAKSYWGVNAASESEAFKLRKLQQNRVGSRFVISFWAVDAEEETTVEQADNRVEEARIAAMNRLSLADFMKLTKKAQAEFVAEGGSVG